MNPAGPSGVPREPHDSHLPHAQEGRTRPRARYTDGLPEHHSRVIVAIDGPAGSGKSTTARRVADRLGWLYLDTGAMYRAVGLAFRDRGLPFTDDAAAALVPALDVALAPDPDGVRVVLDGADVTGRIRTPAAAADASRVSALPAVRQALVALQRRAAEAYDGDGVVVEGRDIGTVVFPDAEVKFFLVADLDARAQRRAADLVALAAARGEAPPPLQSVRDEIAARDARDAGRDVAPLVPAPDAIHLDTTHLDVDAQTEVVLDAVARALAR